jgi:hypothetical protein
MSSALAMVLMTAMTVPGNGPEKVSGEVEQRLDLSGEWEGTWRLGKGKLLDARLSGGNLTVQDNAILVMRTIRFLDEGNGKGRLSCGGGSFIPATYEYKQSEDHVIISYSIGTGMDQHVTLLLRANAHRFRERGPVRLGQASGKDQVKGFL